MHLLALVLIFASVAVTAAAASFGVGTRNALVPVRVKSRRTGSRTGTGPDGR